jgi:DNA-binding NtrC family response regulator
MKEKILLIEDDGSYRVTLAEMLQPHFEIVVADTLAQGIHQALAEQYFCILLDLSLPDSRWPDTFKTFAQITNAPSVVIISGRDEADVVSASIRQGAAGYLIKGRDDVDADHLLSAIRRAVLHRSSERGLETVAKLAHDTAQIQRSEVRGQTSEHKPDEPQN